jgi:hypothetical protein
MVEGLGIMRRLNITLTLLVALVLGACSQGNQITPLHQQVLQAGQQIIASKRNPQGERPPLTRAVLDAVEGSYIEAVVERRDALAYLHVDTILQDQQPGQITVWRTDDNVALIMRNGVLIATRGLGGDLLSAEVPVASNQSGPAHSGAHVMHLRTGANHQRSLSLACDLSNLGAEMVVIVEQSYNTRHLQQRCSGGGGEVVNDYWVDSRAGLVWKSRQWAGPQIGYIRFRRLTTG